MCTQQSVPQFARLCAVPPISYLFSCVAISNLIVSALYKKVAGIVVDGPIRDIDEISKWDFPVYCTGTTPGGPYKEGPGEINVPISCGGINVNLGDIILADPDGVIAIPRNDAATVLEDAKKFQAADEKN